MAEYPDGAVVPMAEIVRRLGCSVSAASPVSASLIKKGMIYSPVYGAIAYTVPMFAEYLKRTMR